jgi:hypothetical protein
MAKHNNSTQKYASACHAIIKDPLRVLFYEDYAGTKIILHFWEKIRKTEK